MKWILHWNGAPGRFALLRWSVLALLALALFPVLAQADSGEVQYESALPNAEGKGPSHNEQIAEKSDTPKHNGGAEAPPSGQGSTEVGGGESTEEPSGSEVGAGTTGGNDGGSGQGSPEHGSKPPGKEGLQAAAPVAHSAPEAAGDGGDSSPLIPILIAIAVLAAISIGAILIRQRRQRDGGNPPLTTKAG